MSTFLQLCQRVRSESGISGDGPSNVAGQTGMYAKIVNWVKQAHEDIQLAEHQWRFDWSQLTQTLVGSQQEYNPVDWGVSMRQIRRDNPYAYRTAYGSNSRTWLSYIDWGSFVHLNTSSAVGIPTYFAEAPDRHIHFYPIPTDGLTLVLEYYKRPEVLVNNTDIPRMPEEYQMAIVWKAVMYCCAEIEDVARFQAADRAFKEVMMKMRVTELAAMPDTETLA